MQRPGAVPQMYEARLVDKTGLISVCAVPWVKGPVRHFEITAPYGSDPVYAIQFDDAFKLSASLNGGEVKLLKWRLSPIPVAADGTKKPVAQALLKRKPVRKGPSLAVVEATPKDDRTLLWPNQALVLKLDRPIPPTVTELRSDFVKHRVLKPDGTIDMMPAEGRAVILPGRKAIAFIPKPMFIKGPEAGLKYNYTIDFNADTTGLEQAAPYYREVGVADNADTVGPWVGKILPGENYINVSPIYAPSAEWSVPLDPATILPGNIRLSETQTDEEVPVTVEYDYVKDRLVVSPRQALRPGTEYLVRLGVGFKDLLGQPLLNPYQWRFHTRSAPPIITTDGGPFVQEMQPAPFSTEVERHTQFCLTFSEPMNAETLTMNHVHLVRDRAGQDVEIDLRYEPELRRLTLTPKTALEPDTHYEVHLDSKSITGNDPSRKTLQGSSEFVFNTE